MNKITMEYSEDLPAVVSLSRKSFEEERMAIKLYEIGRLTSGQTAELAGLSRVVFFELSSTECFHCRMGWC